VLVVEYEFLIVVVMTVDHNDVMFDHVVVGYVVGVDNIEHEPSVAR
jgi:hypothetical protein